MGGTLITFAALLAVSRNCLRTAKNDLLFSSPLCDCVIDCDISLCDCVISLFVDSTIGFELSQNLRTTQKLALLAEKKPQVAVVLLLANKLLLVVIMKR